MSDESVLAEANALINGQRRQDYGGPLESFQRIARLWNAYLDGRPLRPDNEQDPLAPEDVAMLLALLKIARFQNGAGHRDSLVDLAGYAGCVELIMREREPDE